MTKKLTYKKTIKEGGNTMIRMTHKRPYNQKKALELIKLACKKSISRSLFNAKGMEGISIVSDENMVMVKIFGNVQKAYHFLTLTREDMGDIDIKFMEQNVLDPEHQTIVATWFLNPEIIKDAYTEFKKCSTITILNLSQAVEEIVFNPYHYPPLASCSL